MIRRLCILLPALALAACATHAPQPAIYPGSTTGVLEYVNTTGERHAISAQRCGDINQQTFVAMGGDTTAGRIPAGESRRFTMTVGCYSIFMGPDRLSMQGLQTTVNIRPSDQGYHRILSDGAHQFQPSGADDGAEADASPKG